MKKISDIKKQAVKICNECGVPYEDVPITINYRLQRSLGRTLISRNPILGGVTMKKIELSETVMNDKAPEDITVITLVHEYIHTVPGCDNHGPNFQKYCRKIMSKYPEYNMGTYASKEEMNTLHELGLVKTKKEKAKYTLQCEKCGATWYRASMCKFVKYHDRYKCGCGGKIKLL